MWLLKNKTRNWIVIIVVAFAWDQSERTTRSADPPSPGAVAAYTYPHPAEQMAEAVERAIEVHGS